MPLPDADNRTLPLSSDWALRHGCLIPRQHHVVRVTKAASKMGPFDQSVTINCCRRRHRCHAQSTTAATKSTISVHYSRIHIHGGPLHALLKRHFPRPLPAIRMYASPRALQPIINMLYASSVDVGRLPLKRSIRVAHLAYHLGMPELTQAILKIKRPPIMCPEALMTCAPLQRLAIAVGDDTFVDWYLHVTLDVVAQLSLVQAVRLFHLSTRAISFTAATTGGLAHIVKTRLAVQVVRLIRSPCEVHQVKLLLPVLCDLWTSSPTRNTNNPNANLPKHPIDCNSRSCGGRSEWAHNHNFDHTGSPNFGVSAGNYENRVNSDCSGSTTGDEYLIVKCDLSTSVIRCIVEKYAELKAVMGRCTWPKTDDGIAGADGGRACGVRVMMEIDRAEDVHRDNSETEGASSEEQPLGYGQDSNITGRGLQFLNVNGVVDTENDWTVNDDDLAVLSCGEGRSWNNNDIRNVAAKDDDWIEDDDDLMVDDYSNGDNDENNLDCLNKVKYDNEDIDPSGPGSIAEMWKMIAKMDIADQVVNHFVSHMVNKAGASPASFSAPVSAPASSTSYGERRGAKNGFQARSVGRMFIGDVLRHAEPSIESDIVSCQIVHSLVSSTSRDDLLYVLTAKQRNETQRHGTSFHSDVFSSRAMRFVAVSLLARNRLQNTYG